MSVNKEQMLRTEQGFRKEILQRAVGWCKTVGNGKCESPPGAGQVKWDETGPRRNLLRRISVKGSERAALCARRTGQKEWYRRVSLCLFIEEMKAFFIYQNGINSM